MLAKRFIKILSSRPLNLAYLSTTPSISETEKKPRFRFQSKRRFPTLNYRATELKNAIISEELLRRATVAPEVLK